MTDLDKLHDTLTAFAGLSGENIKLSDPCWKPCNFKKGDFYNEYKSICKYLSFIVDGVFRSYVMDAETGEERNVFFYSTNGFVVTFKSFIEQIPCTYYTQALTDATVLQISVNDLKGLYKQSHQWESFGRLLAQEAFNVVFNRMESFIIKTPEQRYLELTREHPTIFNAIPLYHISSYLGIQGPSLSRIRRRLAKK